VFKWIAVAFFAGVLSAYQVQEWRYGEKEAERIINEQSVTIEKQQDAQELTETVAETSNETIQANNTAAADSRAATGRLLNKLREQRLQSSSLATSLTTTRQTLDMRTAMLESYVERSRILADYAESARAAGLSCEAQYDGLVKIINGVEE